MTGKSKKIFLLVFAAIFCVFSMTSALKAEDDPLKKIKKFKKGDKFLIALIPEKNIFEQRKRYKYKIGRASCRERV